MHKKSKNKVVHVHKYHPHILTHNRQLSFVSQCVSYTYITHVNHVPNTPVPA